MEERDKKSRRDLSDVQSGLNRWLFSLKKSNDPTRKHFELCKGSADPNRVIWAHVNEITSKRRITMKKPTQKMKENCKHLEIKIT